MKINEKMFISNTADIHLPVYGFVDLLCTCVFVQPPPFIPPYNLFHYLRELTCYKTKETSLLPHY